MPQARLKVAILGAQGRFGSLIAQEVDLDPKQWQEPVLVARSTPKKDSVMELLLSCDLIIDASLPEASVPWLQALLKFSARSKTRAPKRVPVFLIGSTGWKPAQMQILRKWSQKTLVLQSSNFSMGMMLLKAAILRVAPELARLGFETTLIDTHHRAKVDTPSGTAKMLREAATRVAPDLQMPVVSIRSGTVVGRHEWHLEGPHESLVFLHEATDRRVFARGATQLGTWLCAQRKNRALIRRSLGQILSMDDVVH